MSENVIVAIVTGLFGLAGMYFTYLLEPKKKKGKEEVRPSLKNHHIFSRTEMLRNYIEMKFTLPNKGKELVFRDMILNYIKIWEKELAKLAEQLEEVSDDVNSTEFQAIIMKSFNNGTHEFTNYYKNSSYSLDEQQCLGLVMAKFNTWNYQRVQSFGNSLLSVCNSQFYSTKTIKSAVIFDMYIQLFVDMANDAEQTIGSVNGDLTGLIFRGVTL